MRRNKILIGQVRMAAVAAVLVVASGFGAADAQQGMHGGDMPMGHEGMGHGGMMGPGMMHGGGMQMGHEGMGHEGMMGPGMMMCRMGEHIDGRLAYLKAELKIAEAQTPQWNAFADAFRASGQKAAQHCAMMKEHDGSMMSTKVPERLNMMEQHMTMHLENMRAIKAALQPLYSVLSDEQKKTADELMKGMPAMWG
ncbi:Spy/CpxP family protein refolding chaperone [Methylocapsa aurea]|uniref:Spy/CpxP family protein refolding chaperone n=1 Tax=Methylocapsa aurea TaxID=663610 RepID=UPI00056C01A2|nr:Spy/CpxP family protein refolding chaperone [Methylocapsa aurea]